MQGADATEADSQTSAPASPLVLEWRISNVPSGDKYISRVENGVYTYVVFRFDLSEPNVERQVVDERVVLSESQLSELAETLRDMQLDGIARDGCFSNGFMTEGQRWSLSVRDGSTMGMWIGCSPWPYTNMTNPLPPTTRDSMAVFEPLATLLDSWTPEGTVPMLFSVR